ncbi:helix-turn-helix domain-containing protein [Thalassotalea nanhaiensis]|uniref:helix-turn-helix domain-containing protein n=1 Tax=Thalassotalea nanhaiensis TaxID=3065648 RepID=UPI003863EE68
MNIDNLITATEACKRLKICRKTLWSYMYTHEHRKLIKAFKRSGRHLFFCPDSLDHFCNQVFEEVKL